MSKLATNKCGEERNCVAVMDVKSAFLYGRARRPIIIEVHTEDPRSQLDGVLAKLVGSLLGTRDAPMIGRDCLRGQIKLFHHETKGVEMIAHVDDLFVVGCLKDVQDVCRGFADASDMKRTYAGPKTGNHEVDAKLLATLADDTRSYMPPTDARRPRSAVARVVCVTQDRPDLDVVA